MEKFGKNLEENNFLEWKKSSKNKNNIIFYSIFDPLIKFSHRNDREYKSRSQKKIILGVGPLTKIK